MIKTVNASPFIPALKGAFIALIFSVGATLASAFFLTESKNLDIMTSVLPKVLQVISALIGGFFAGKFAKERGYISGIFSGLIFSAIIVIGSLINSGFKFYYSIISVIAITTASLIGSLLAKDRGQSSAAKRKSIMKMMRS